MRLEMRNPASGERGARGIEQFGDQLSRETTTPVFVVEKLQSRLGVSLPVAALIAELAFAQPGRRA